MNPSKRSRTNALHVNGIGNEEDPPARHKKRVCRKAPPSHCEETIPEHEEYQESPGDAMVVRDMTINETLQRGLFAAKQIPEKSFTNITDRERSAPVVTKETMHQCEGYAIGMAPTAQGASIMLVWQTAIGRQLVLCAVHDGGKGTRYVRHPDGSDKRVLLIFPVDCYMMLDDTSFKFMFANDRGFHDGHYEHRSKLGLEFAQLALVFVMKDDASAMISGCGMISPLGHTEGQEISVEYGKLYWGPHMSKGKNRAGKCRWTGFPPCTLNAVARQGGCCRLHAPGGGTKRKDSRRPPSLDTTWRAYVHNCKVFRTFELHCCDDSFCLTSVSNGTTAIAGSGGAELDNTELLLLPVLNTAFEFSKWLRTASIGKFKVDVPDLHVLEEACNRLYIACTTSRKVLQSWDEEQERLVRGVLGKGEDEEQCAIQRLVCVGQVIGKFNDGKGFLLEAQTKLEKLECNVYENCAQAGTCPRSPSDYSDTELESEEELDIPRSEHEPLRAEPVDTISDEPMQPLRVEPLQVEPLRVELVQPLRVEPAQLLRVQPLGVEFVKHIGFVQVGVADGSIRTTARPVQPSGHDILMECENDSATPTDLQVTAAAPVAKVRPSSQFGLPIPVATAHKPLGEIGFRAGQAARNGDCFPLSVGSGFEFYDATKPSPATHDRVRAIRNAAVDLVCGDGTIGGVAASVVRTAECLPKGKAMAERKLKDWRANGHWMHDGANDLFSRSTAFMFGVAAANGRPIIVMERTQKNTILDPCFLYGEHKGKNLITTPARGTVPETVPFVRQMQWAEVLSSLKASPRAFSLVEYDRANSHHSPMVFTEAEGVTEEVVEEVAEEAAAANEAGKATTPVPIPSESTATPAAFA